MFMRILFKSVYSLKEDLNEIHLSRKFELQKILLKLKEKNSVIHINIIYKQKANKIQLLNLEKMISETSDELIN